MIGQNIEILRNIAEINNNPSNRAYGKTHSLCLLARQENAVLLTHNRSFGRNLELKYNIETVSFSQFIHPRYDLRGRKLLMDQDSMMIFLSPFVAEVDEIKRRIRYMFKELEMIGHKDVKKIIADYRDLSDVI